MKRRGAVVVLSVGLVVFLSTVGAAFLMRGLHENRLGDRSAARQEAFYLAEAAIDRASLNLRTPTDLTDDLMAMALPTGTFQIDSPMQSLGSNRWMATARGTSGQEQRRIEAIFQLTPQSIFQFALFGQQEVSVTGSAATDSYVSTNGAYDPNNHGHNGDVGTNATSAGGITVGGSIFVDGQLVVGPNVSNPESVVTGYNPAFVTGDPKVASQMQTFPMPPVVLNQADFTALLNNGDGDCLDYTVTGNTTQTLSATGGLNNQGVYCYRNLTIQGNGTLTADGSVTVYVTGTLTAQGNSGVGVSSDPTKMTFLMTANSQATLEEGTITGSNKFYGALYGPSATINIQGNADVYGSIIAKTVNVTGSASIHYDEALTQNTTVTNLHQVGMVSWRELN